MVGIAELVAEERFQLVVGQFGIYLVDGVGPQQVVIALEDNLTEKFALFGDGGIQFGTVLHFEHAQPLCLRFVQEVVALLRSLLTLDGTLLQVCLDRLAVCPEVGEKAIVRAQSAHLVFRQPAGEGEPAIADGELPQFLERGHRTSDGDAVGIGRGRTADLAVHLLQVFRAVRNQSVV